MRDSDSGLAQYVRLSGIGRKDPGCPVSHPQAWGSTGRGSGPENNERRVAVICLFGKIGIINPYVKHFLRFHGQSRLPLQAASIILADMRYYLWIFIIISLVKFFVFLKKKVLFMDIINFSE